MTDPQPGSFDSLLNPRETRLEAARRRVWETTERIDHLNVEAQGICARLGPPNLNESLRELTKILILLESHRTTLQVQQDHLAMLQEDDHP